jgi:hypothetical protein
MPSAAPARSSTLGVVELERAGDRVQYPGRHSGQGTAFQFGVVLDADASQGGDLAAAQPRDPAAADVGQAGLLWGDLGPPRDEELADLGAVVHGFDGTFRDSTVGCPASTPFTRNSPIPHGRG